MKHLIMNKMIGTDFMVMVVIRAIFRGLLEHGFLILDFDQIKNFAQSDSQSKYELK